MTDYLKRIYRHIFPGPYRARQLFDSTLMNHLQGKIEASEAQHSAQLRLVIDGGLSLSELLVQKSARDKAVELFSALRVWDTEANNGILLYILLPDHSIEIVADRGITRCVQEANEGQTWEQICSDVVKAFKRGHFKEGLEVGIEELTTVLARYFPPQSGQTNELHDTPLRI